MDKKGNRIEALVEGLTECEKLQCDTTVGFGGSPDEKGETTLDALIMDGPEHKVGAVAALRRIKDAARVAWAIMNFTEHTLLVGEKATQFAINMGFKEESLETELSKKIHYEWQNAACQPNYWKDVFPDSKKFCGPYQPSKKVTSVKSKQKSNPYNHDTIGMIIIDKNSDISAGTSRAYVDNDIGAAGNGDIMMRYAPGLLTVELMRSGISPKSAALEAIRRIQTKYPSFFGAIVAANKEGDYGAACSGIPNFSYSFVGHGNTTVGIKTVDCF